MNLAIVMPAYNEEECIELVLKGWLEICEKLGGCLIVVNDGSRDRTGEKLDRIASMNPHLHVVHQKNAGHGQAVLRGYHEALATGAEYIFQTDSDDQFKPGDFWALWNVRNTSPFILGYRQKRFDPLHRLVITRIVIYLNVIFFGVHLKDSNIPFRLIRAPFLRDLLAMFPNSVFAPNIFLSVLAAKAGCNLYEFPITHVERQTGTVSIVRWKLIKICFRCCRELLSFRLFLLGSRTKLKTTAAKYA